MTETLRDDLFDRQLRGFLAEYAKDVAGAPRPEDAAAAIAERVIRRAAGRRRVGLQAAWVVLAVLLAAALLGALVAGMGPQWDLGSQRYEAVFVRADLAASTNGDLVVFAVDGDGHERVVLRLPLRPGERNLPAPQTAEQAALSPSGLLVTRRFDSDYNYVFEIVDLLRPGSSAIVVPGIRPDYDTRFNPAFWGPADQLAISWYVHPEQPDDRHLSFVEGRSGSLETLPQPVTFDAADAVPFWAVPFDLSHPRRPFWTADGRGLVVGTTGAGMKLLLRDGSRVFEPAGVFMDGLARQFTAAGDRLLADPRTVYRLRPNGTREPLFSRPDRQLDLAWAHDGAGAWLLVDTAGEGTGTLQHETPGGVLERLILTTPDRQPGWELTGSMLGIAPRDELLVVTFGWSPSVEEPDGNPPDLATLLVRPGTGAAIAVDGTFAGWLAVPD